jgi:hypothetical protein
MVDVFKMVDFYNKRLNRNEKTRAQSPRLYKCLIQDIDA